MAINSPASDASVVCGVYYKTCRLFSMLNMIRPFPWFVPQSLNDYTRMVVKCHVVNSLNYSGYVYKTALKLVGTS